MSKASDEAWLTGEVEELASLNVNLGYPLPGSEGHYSPFPEGACGPLGARNLSPLFEISLHLEFKVSCPTARVEAQQSPLR